MGHFLHAICTLNSDAGINAKSTEVDLNFISIAKELPDYKIIFSF